MDTSENSVMEKYGIIAEIMKEPKQIIKKTKEQPLEDIKNTLINSQINRDIIFEPPQNITN